MQQVKISDLRGDFRHYSWVAMRGTPLEVTSQGEPVGVLLKSSAIELNDSMQRLPRSGVRAQLSDCCDGFLEGVNAYVVTYHGKPKTVFLSPEFAKECGVYEV